MQGREISEQQSYNCIESSFKRPLIQWAKPRDYGKESVQVIVPRLDGRGFSSADPTGQPAPVSQPLGFLTGLLRIP